MIDAKALVMLLLTWWIFIQITIVQTRVFVKSRIDRYAPSFILEVSTNRLIICAVACSSHNSCVYFSYHDTRKVCYMYDRAYTTTTQTTSDTGLMTYSDWPGLKINLAYLKPTAQSGEFISSATQSSKAVDGQLNGNTRTQYATPAWWCVDLQSVYKISDIFIYNVKYPSIDMNRLSGFKLNLASTGGCSGATFSSSTLCRRDYSGAHSMYTVRNCYEGKIIEARIIFISQQNMIMLREVVVIENFPS